MKSLKTQARKIAKNTILAIPDFLVETASSLGKGMKLKMSILLRSRKQGPVFSAVISDYSVSGGSDIKPQLSTKIKSRSETDNNQMSGQTDLLVTLQQYIVELQNQNKALKSHIYMLQNKQENLQANFHDQLEKIKVYVEHCEQEIIKREKREVGILELVQELQIAKDEIAKERDIYIQEIENIRTQTAAKLEEAAKIAATQAKPPPPKPGKCKQCEVFAKNTEIMRQQMQRHQDTIDNLKQDIECLSFFI